MSKPTPLQLLGVIAFLAFYGFAVFAVTRDYFLRHPPQVASVPTLPQPAAAGRSSTPKITLDSDSTIPAAVIETNPALLAQRADDLLSQGRYMEAIPMYRRLLEQAADNLDAYNDLGLALHYAGQTAEALGVLSQGASKGPQFQRIWLTYGFVQSQAGDRAGAAATLARARDLSPDTDIGKEAVRLLGSVQAPPR
jgi:tetratricopeptide (TPR) repeat protein